MIKNQFLLFAFLFLLLLEGGNHWFAIPVLVVFNLLLLARVKKVFLPPQKLVLIYLFWLVLSTITIFYSVDKEQTILTLLAEYLLFVSFLTFCFLKLPFTKIKKFINRLAILSIFISFLWFVFPKLLPKIIGFENPLTFVLGQNHLADLLLYPFLLNLNIVFSLLTVLFLIGIIFSLSRSVWFSLGLTIFLFIKNRRIKMFGIFFALLLTVFSVLLFTKKIPKTFKKEFFGSRQYYWRQAVVGLKNHPFGVGLGNFGFLSRKCTLSPSVVSDYTHNFFLEKFAETGWFGGIVFLILTIMLLKFSYSSSYFPLLFCAASNAALGFSWNFPVFRLLFLFFAAAALPKSEYSSEKGLSRALNIFLLVILCFWTGFNFYFKYSKQELTEDPIEKIALFPANPLNYLEIDYLDENQKRQLFEQYLALSKKGNIAKEKEVFRRAASEIFLQGALLEIEAKNYPLAFAYTKEIFKSWPWERNWFEEIGLNLPDDLEVKKQFAEIFMDKSFRDLNDNRIFLGRFFLNLWQKTKDEKYLLKSIQINPFEAEFYRQILKYAQIAGSPNLFYEISEKCLKIFPKDLCDLE